MLVSANGDVVDRPNEAVCGHALSGDVWPLCGKHVGQGSGGSSGRFQLMSCGDGAQLKRSQISEKEASTQLSGPGFGVRYRQTKMERSCGVPEVCVYPIFSTHYSRGQRGQSEGGKRSDEPLHFPPFFPCMQPPRLFFVSFLLLHIIPCCRKSPAFRFQFFFLSGFEFLPSFVRRGCCFRLSSFPFHLPVLGTSRSLLFLNGLYFCILETEDIEERLKLL